MNPCILAQIAICVMLTEVQSSKALGVLDRIQQSMCVVSFKHTKQQSPRNNSSDEHEPCI